MDLITIGVVVWGILVTVGGILDWFRGDKLYKQSLVAKDAKIDLLSAEVERLKQISPSRAHEELLGEKEYYESILLRKQRIISDAEKVIDRLGEEVLAKGIERTLTAEELKLVEEEKAALEEEVERLRTSLNRVPDMFASITSSSSALESTLGKHLDLLPPESRTYVFEPLTPVTPKIVELFNPKPEDDEESD